MTDNSRQTGSKPKALATDLDGTLIPLADNDANRDDLKVLAQQLKDENIPLAFVTGRHLEIVENAITTYQLPLPNWIICDVGTSIYEAASDGWQLVDDYRDHLATICAALPIPELRNKLAAFDGLRLQEDEKQGAFKLSYYVEQANVEAIAGEMRRWIEEEGAPYSLIDSVDPFTNDGLIDLLPRDVSKAYALEWWRENIGLEKTDIVFSGDSGNDWAALVAGYRAIVVGNTDRQLAQRVQQHHDEQGWTDRLYVASAEATSAVLDGSRWFGLISFPDS